MIRYLTQALRITLAYISFYPYIVSSTSGSNHGFSQTSFQVYYPQYPMANQSTEGSSSSSHGQAVQPDHRPHKKNHETMSTVIEPNEFDLLEIPKLPNHY